jgi:hypothetical protein
MAFDIFGKTFSDLVIGQKKLPGKCHLATPARYKLDEFFFMALDRIGY